MSDSIKLATKKKKAKDRPKVKTVKLKKIKQNIDIKKKNGKRSAAGQINSNAFLEFNGQKPSGNKDEDKKKKVEAFYKAKKQIKLWMEKDAIIDSTKVSNLAKKLLEPAELENARLISEEMGTYLYIAYIGLLDARLNVIEDDLLHEGRGRGDEDEINEDQYAEFVEIYKDCLSKDGYDEESGMIVEPTYSEYNEEIKIVKDQLNEWEGFGEDEWNKALEDGKKKEDKKMEDKKEDKKLGGKKEVEDKEDEDIDEERDEEAINLFKKEIDEGKLRIADDKLNQKFFDDLNGSRNSLNEYLKNAAKILQPPVKFNLTNEEFAKLGADKIKEASYCSYDQMLCVAQLLLQNTNDTQTAFIYIIIKSLAERCKALEGAILELTKSVKTKVEIDEKHVVKEKGNVQMKKIFRGDYIPQKDWEKLSNIDKALHNLRDFAQFPKPSIWKNFKDDEKLKFFEYKLRWNIDRAKFLAALASGVKPDEDLARYRWNCNISLTRAITCNLYYGDKFSDGFRVKEFSELWKKSKKELRIEANTERGKLKQILIKLNSEKKISDASVYYENWLVKLSGLYWENALEKLKQAREENFRRAKYYYHDKDWYGYKDKGFLEKKRKPPDGGMDIDDPKGFA